MPLSVLSIGGKSMSRFVLPHLAMISCHLISVFGKHGLLRPSHFAMKLGDKYVRDLVCERLASVNTKAGQHLVQDSNCLVAIHR